METESLLLSEVAGATQDPAQKLTNQQKERLAYLDWYINELGVVMEENKEYGILQAHWRHQDRFNIIMLEGLRKT